MRNERYLLRIALAAVCMTTLLLPLTAMAASESNPGGTIPAQHRDVKAHMYDKLRGTYGADYSYDWGSNKYTFVRNFSTPAPQPSTDLSRAVVIDGRLDERLWNEIEPSVVTLSPTHPWGGSVGSVSVRAMNNGTWLFLAFQWDDQTESRQSTNRVKNPEGGFQYNSTNFFPDDLYIGWWRGDAQPNVKPWFNFQYAGTTTNQVPWNNDPTAKVTLWSFKSYSVDDDAPYWPLHYTEPRTWRWGPYVGKPLIFPYPHLVETLLNSTANYVLGTGLTHVRACAFPDQDTFPFDVRGNGKWKDGSWTLEVARPFEPHQQNKVLDASISFESGRSYQLFFGASDGNHGETEDIGSISGWLTLDVQPPSSSAIDPWFLATAGAAVAAIIAGAFGVRKIRRNAN